MFDLSPGDMPLPVPDTMTPAQRLRLIGTPEVPALVDVSTDADVEAGTHPIPGAVRHPHTDRNQPKDGYRRQPEAKRACAAASGWPKYSPSGVRPAARGPAANEPVRQDSPRPPVAA